jgi:predicted nucleic acid-binding Zn ribbon protein
VPDDKDRQRQSLRAAAELDRAKADAKARGQRPPAATGEATRREYPAAPGDAGQRDAGRGGKPAGTFRSRTLGRGRRGRRDDPQPLRTAIDGLLGDQGWRTAAAVGSVFGRWDHIAGRDLAAHTRPERFSDGEVVVIADSTAWATQVRLLASTLVRRLNEELGDGTVRRVIVRGPAPPRLAGPWRVRGTRPYRGDYG